MKQHSAEYMVDVEKMFVGGDSSGAHAAMFSQIIQDDNMDADVKGTISFYGANSMMLPDGTPSTLNHHLPDSPEGKEMGGMNLREHPELCRKCPSNVFSKALIMAEASSGQHCSEDEPTGCREVCSISYSGGRTGRCDCRVSGG